MIAVKLTKPTVFAVSATSFPPTNTAFKVFVDNVELPTYLHEGATSIVEVRSNLVIKRLVATPNPNVPEGIPEGTWKVVQDPEIPSINYSFIGTLPNRTLLLTNYSTLQETVVQLSDKSFSPACSNGFMNVFVDGNPITDFTFPEPVNFGRGSTVYCAGKSVIAAIYGVCSTDINAGFAGFVKVKQTR